MEHASKVVGLALDIRAKGEHGEKSKSITLCADKLNITKFIDLSFLEETMVALRAAFPVRAKPTVAMIEDAFIKVAEARRGANSFVDAFTWSSDQGAFHTSHGRVPLLTVQRAPQRATLLQAPPSPARRS